MLTRKHQEQSSKKKRRSRRPSDVRLHGHHDCVRKPVVSPVATCSFSTRQTRQSLLDSPLFAHLNDQCMRNTYHHHDSLRARHRVAKTFNNCLTIQVHATHCHNPPRSCYGLLQPGVPLPQDRICITCRRPTLAPPRILPILIIDIYSPVNTRSVAN